MRDIAAVEPHSASIHTRGTEAVETMDEGAATLQPTPAIVDPERSIEIKVDIVDATDEKNAAPLRPQLEIPSRETSHGSHCGAGTHLEQLRAATTLLRLRVSGTCVFVGVSCFMLGILLSFVVHADWTTRIGTWTALVSQVILLHSVLPFDRRAILALAWFGILQVVFGLYMFTVDIIDSTKSFDQEAAAYWGCVIFRDVVVIFFLIGKLGRLSYKMRVQGSGELLRFMWKFSRTWVSLSICLYLLLAIAALGSKLIDHFIIYFSHLIVYTLCMTLLLSHVRTKTRQCLIGADGAVKIAAIIAGLMAGTDPKKVWAEACKRFRGISCEKLTREIMANQQPDPKLYELSRPARWGEVDAFLTHSWHDDPDAKWRVLQHWRMNFKATHHREPVLWIDKFCIDQTDIEHSLQCLPVWLAECQKLLIIAGSTYLTRLWCIMELFTYLLAGGDQHAVVLCTLHASNRFDTLVREFNAAEATCFLQHDKLRLLSVIEGAFGSLDGFNERVREELTGLLDSSTRLGSRLSRAVSETTVGQPGVPEGQDEVGGDEFV